MGYIGLSVKIKGELPTDKEMNTLIGIPATVITRKGDLISSKKSSVWSKDTWSLDLTPDLDFDSTEDEIQENFALAGVLLDRIAPNISCLNRDQFSVTLYINYIREEQQGGLTLSQELISAIALARMEIHVLVLVAFDE
jgi:hypothetical protein